MTKQEIIETLKKEIAKGEYQMAGCLAVPLDFLKSILKELEGDGWISVEDRLPEDEKNVFAILNGKLCIMNYMSYSDSGITYKVWGYVYDSIEGDAEYDDNYLPTHWQPLPTPPKNQQ